jgi:hypothetical protein
MDFQVMVVQKLRDPIMTGLGENTARLNRNSIRNHSSNIISDMIKESSSGGGGIRGRKRGRGSNKKNGLSSMSPTTSSTLEDEVDLPDSLIKDIFEDDEIQMSAVGDLLLESIGDEELDEYDESSEDGESGRSNGGDNQEEGSSMNSFSPYDQEMMGMGSIGGGGGSGGSSSSGSSQSGSGGSISGSSNSTSGRGKRRYNRQGGQMNSQSSEGNLDGMMMIGLGDLEDAGGNGSEASDGKGGSVSGKRKQVLSSRERNLRRLESNERERQRMHSLNDAFQVSSRNGLSVCIIIMVDAHFCLDARVLFRTIEA